MEATPTDPIARAAKEQLTPLFDAVLEQFKADDAVFELSFFTLQYDALNRLKDDMDVAELFLQLSSVAFHGFDFSPEQAIKVDLLLAQAEQIAHALSADGNSSH